MGPERCRGAPGLGIRISSVAFKQTSKSRRKGRVSSTRGGPLRSKIPVYYFNKGIEIGVYRLVNTSQLSKERSTKVTYFLSK